MAGVPNNNQTDGVRRGMVPFDRGDGGAKTTYVGVRRGFFPPGEATVLVLDHFRDLWELYSCSIPKESNVLFVRDTTTALEALRQNPGVGVIVAQGLSRRTTHPEVDEMFRHSIDLRTLAVWYVAHSRSGALEDWLDSHRNTMTFLKDLQAQGFEGLVQVVSRMTKPYQQRELCELEGLRVQYMDKQDFFSGTFAPKANRLWRRIERLEDYERKTGKRLSPTSPIGKEFDDLLEQVVYPHPAEDRLFGRWEDALLNEYNRHGATAVEMALTWLHELKLKIESGDSWAIYTHASQLPELRPGCECMVSATVPGYAWLGFLHALHDDFNLAVWEILEAAGLMEWMRLQLEFDMACQNPRSSAYGKHTSRAYGQKLRGFFRPEGPSGAWVIWRPKSRY